MKTAKIYLSDEGFGHIIRQRAILEALIKLDSGIAATIQTHAHIAAVRRLIPNVETVDKFSNITWAKSSNGSPDVQKIHTQFLDYESRADKFIQEEILQDKPDFIVSDFVYEAFEIGQQLKTPTFGVAHFTWDWFFCKLFPPPLSTKLVNRLFEQAKSAKKLYFPPFTPDEILSYYKATAKQVPLIIRSEINPKSLPHADKIRVMIIDSGAGVLAESIYKSLGTLSELDDFHFFVSSKFKVELSNVSFIPAKELMVDYAHNMDLVIGRAGFNTITECIGLRVPMLLIGEAQNPEMNENILNLKKAHLGSFISMETFEEHLHSFLPVFFKHEYPLIRQAMKDHDMPTNGAEVVAEDILNSL
jgi:uncharacterized protein (TIGR00661 family)